MEQSFLDKWLYIIRNCSYDNSYKAAWAKAITEIAVEYEYDNEKKDIVEINLVQIAKKVLRYFWEQTIYFNLIQGSNPLKPPKILSLTNELIEIYKKKTGTNQPIKYIKSGVETICQQEYEKTIKEIIKTLKADVSYRFLNISGEKVAGVYEYAQGDNSLFIQISNLRELKLNHDIVFDAVNYRWAQILESFNHSPRICKKVKIIDVEKIRRTSLEKFTKYIEYENPDHVCFICGEKIERESISIDHVIPFSYLYSDDLWNLVFVHKGCNSAKSNIIPTEEFIEDLERRNISLLKLLNKNGINDKQVAELQAAIDNNYVRKFWIGCKG